VKKKKNIKIKMNLASCSLLLRLLAFNLLIGTRSLDAFFYTVKTTQSGSADKKSYIVDNKKFELLDHFKIDTDDPLNLAAAASNPSDHTAFPLWISVELRSSTGNGQITMLRFVKSLISSKGSKKGKSNAIYTTVDGKRHDFGGSGDDKNKSSSFKWPWSLASSFFSGKKNQNRVKYAKSKIVLVSPSDQV
jgi:hypothetical protein